MSRYILIPVTDEMQRDLAECERMSEDGEDKDCDGCSLNGGEEFGCMGELHWCERRSSDD